MIALLALHVTESRANSAPGSAHALDLERLHRPNIHFWTIWDGDNLVGMGALKWLSTDHGEVKSMRTVKRVQRSGVGSAMLSHIIGVARTLGVKRLSLETGSWPYFDAARAFYTGHGFVQCGPFGDYVTDPNSIFMTVEILA